MLTNLEKYLAELDALNLDKDDYMISGGGTLAVLGIRDCGDIDLVVANETGEKLREMYPENTHEGEHCDKIMFPNIEIMWNFKNPFPGYSSKELMDSAVVIDGRKYQDLESIKFFKARHAREKDLVDLVLIDSYEKNRK